VEVVVRVIWLVVPLAGLELVERTELVVAETTLLVVPLLTGLELVERMELVVAETTLLVVPLLTGLVEEEEEIKLDVVPLCTGWL